MKIVDEQFKTKFKSLLAVKLKDDSLTLPIWANNGEYILKVKKQHVNNLYLDFEPRRMYSIRVEFIYYEFETPEKKIIKGYYSRAPQLNDLENETEIDNEEEPTLSNI